MGKYGRKADILNGVIWQQLLLFFFPILLSMFFQQLYNTVDAIIVGNVVGKQALAAVGGPTNTIINLLIGFFTGLATGAGVVIAQLYGAGSHERLRAAVSTSFVIAFAGSAFLMAVGIPFAPQLLKIMNTPADVIVMATLYMRIYFAGILPNLFYNMGAGILRAVGDSRRPLYFLIAACVTNIVLDTLFVAVFGWGVAGVAWATVIAQAVSAVLIGRCLDNPDEPYAFSLKQITCDRQLLQQIIRIGLPTGLQSILFSLSNMLIQASINILGTDAVAAYTAYGKMDGFFWGTSNAWGASVMTFCSQNFGAGKITRLKKSIWIGAGMYLVTTALMVTIFLTSGPGVLRLFTSDPTVIQIGLTMIHFLVPTFFIYMPIEIISGAQRGTGDSIVPTLITALGVVGTRAVWITMFAAHSVIGVLTCYPLSWGLTSAAFLIYFFRGTWLQKRLQAREKQLLPAGAGDARTSKKDVF